MSVSTSMDESRKSIHNEMSSKSRLSSYSRDSISRSSVQASIAAAESALDMLLLTTDQQDNYVAYNAFELLMIESVSLVRRTIKSTTKNIRNDEDNSDSDDDSDSLSNSNNSSKKKDNKDIETAAANEKAVKGDSNMNDIGKKKKESEENDEDDEDENEEEDEDDEEDDEEDDDEDEDEDEDWIFPTQGLGENGANSYDQLRIIELNELSMNRLQSMGYRVGQGLVERFSCNRPRFSETLDVMKFICKDIWTTLYKKQVDNLKTNHRGMYVLTDNNFKLFMRMSTEYGASDAVLKAGPFLWHTCGIIQGILAGLGIQSTVTAETITLPIAVFQVQSLR